MAGPCSTGTSAPTPAQLDAFCERVWQQGAQHYRSLPWRDTRDAYAILVSEVMLQQTQVSRVLERWEAWLEVFPTPEALAAAPLAPVLALWQGLGYNRRALNLKRACEAIVERFDGHVPSGYDELVSLPGIGPASAAGICAFAFECPGVYLETNVRAVFLHELFPEREKVSDSELVPLVEATCPESGRVRAWYYALLDYGAYLKRSGPNPSRRSAGYTRQSAFAGSRRQKRAWLVRRLLDGPATAEELAADLSAAEQRAGRDALEQRDVEELLEELAGEGFATCEDGLWSCAD